MNIKKVQSEMGATGLASPNIPVVEKVGSLLDNFQHDHGTITDKDCHIFIAACAVGHAYKHPEELKLMTSKSVTGCHTDLENMIAILLYKEQDLIPVFQAGILAAIQNILANAKIL
jgi:hypothetical protein